MVTNPVAVAVHVGLHTFVLNAAVCDAGTSYIAPTVQPDYSALRPGDSLKHDVVPHIDLHGCESSKTNPRISDFRTGKPRMDRMGIYLHWTLPPPFRVGTAKTQTAGGPDTLKGREVPDRWVIFRQMLVPIDQVDVGATGRSAGPHVEFHETFMIESNRIRRIQDDELTSLDVETDLAPFLDSTVGAVRQGNSYLGKRSMLREWQETETASNQSPSSHFHPFTILGSSNPYFADYQAHNAGVFSIHDDLTYHQRDPTSPNKFKTITAASANVSYLVVGYYSPLSHDPLFTASSLPSKDLLKTFRLKLSEKQKDLDLGKEPLRLICLGASNHNAWNSAKAPAKQAAKQASDLFQSSHPLAVGEDLIDAVSAWFSRSSDANHIKLAEAMRTLQRLTVNLDNSDEAMLRTIQQMKVSFEPSDGGQTWHLAREQAKANKKNVQFVPARPEELLTLRALNAAQRLWDTSSRQFAFLKHLYYCEWWKYRASGISEQDADKLTTSPAADLKEQLRHYRTVQGTQGLLSDLGKVVENLSPGGASAPYKSIPNTRFYTWKDPALALVGLESDWLIDPTQDIEGTLLYPDNTAIELTHDPKGQAIFGGAEKLPPWLQSVCINLYRRWVKNAGLQSKQQFEDYASSSIQQFYPLFVEWEAQYFHIPWESWVLKELPTGLVKYEIDTEVHPPDFKTLANKYRGLSGRTSIVPEPLKTVTQQIELILKRKGTFSKADPSDKEPARIADPSWKSILSGTLTGISDHLLTLAHGNHLVPNPKDYSDDRQDYFRDRRTMGTTPYGPVPVDGVPEQADGRTTGPVFRSVTHGQVRFTKFNVVDKFGQVICAIDPQRRASNEPGEKIYPRVSDALACQTHPGTRLPVTPEAVTAGETEFFQLAPRINQDVRLNAHYVLPEEDQSGWRATLEWENPVWAWLTVNFKDTSIQVYTGNGAFRGELLIGRGEGARWINPFSRDQDELQLSATSLQEIDRFMYKLQMDDDSRENVWKMLVDANENISHAPSSYADFLPALLGRPMAMVTMGFSLELATAPMQDQSPPKSSSADALAKDLLDYEFEVKIGHKDSLHDGFVGLIPQLPATSDKLPPELMRFNYNKIYTSFGHGSNIAEGQSIEPLVAPQELCKLTPYFVNPGERNATAQDIMAFQKEHYSHLRIFTGIVDAFHPIHIFSGILPMQTLQIPPMVLEQSLRTMCTVFRSGPLLVPGDIPTQAAIDAAGHAELDRNPNVTRAHLKIPVDAPSVGNWHWLQPVRNKASSTTTATTMTPATTTAPAGITTPTSIRSFRDFETKRMDRSFNLPKGPSTAVEGFLWLRNPTTGQEKPPPPPAPGITNPSPQSVPNPVTIASLLTNAVQAALPQKKS